MAAIVLTVPVSGDDDGTEQILIQCQDVPAMTSGQVKVKVLHGQSATETNQRLLVLDLPRATFTAMSVMATA